MIYIIIGQSGAGKTTYVKRRFIEGKRLIAQRDFLPFALTDDNIALIGKYNVGIRTEGTDTLPYNSSPKIADLVVRLSKDGLDVVVEGDRINNTPFFRRIAASREPATLILLTCRVATSLKRLHSVDSLITPAFVKGTKTKSRNNYLNWCSEFRGEIINTDGDYS